MARLIPLEDPGDDRLADYVGLRDVQLRKSLEVEHGLFIAEGEKVLRRAVGAGYPVRSVLLTERWLPPLTDLLDRIDAPVFVVPEAVAEGVTGFPVHRGALAAMARRPLPAVAELIGTARRIVVLEDLVDHGNVGAIFRCAAALGVDAVLLAPRCADPLYRRAVKVSMGAVFAVPYARITDWYAGLEQLRTAGFRLLALAPGEPAEPLWSIDPGRRCALLLGTEGDGLSARWLDVADARVRIPMSGDAVERGVDSLNVVAAAAIACYSLMGADRGEAGPGHPESPGGSDRPG
jgi:tRNA G18 (ribose-2'-O)-methylase SpoU